MSDNPYAPPVSDLGAEPPSAASQGTGDFDIGRCLSDGWAGTWENFPLWLGVGLVAGLLLLLATVTVIGIFLLVPVLFWGGLHFSLRMHDGEAEFRDLFAGFSRFGAALGNMLAVFLILALVGLAGQSIQIAGQLNDNLAVLAVGYLVNLAVGLLISSRLGFAYFYVVDRDTPAVEAIRTAWEQTDPVKWKVVLLVLLTWAIYLAGLLVFVIGVIPASVIAALTWVSAFRQLAGKAG